MGSAARARAAAAGDPDALNRLRARLPAEETVPLAADDDLVAAWEEAKIATFAGRTGRDRAAKAAAEASLAEARSELESCGLILWVLRSQGRKAYDELVGTHPPTAAELAEAKTRGGGEPMFSMETFPAALVAVSTVGGLAGITGAEIMEMVDDGRVSAGELGHLFAKCMGLYTGTRIPDLGKG